MLLLRTLGDEIKRDELKDLEHGEIYIKVSKHLAESRVNCSTKHG